MATQVITNHHHVTFSGSSQALRHSSPGPGPTTSYSANGGLSMMNGSSFSNGGVVAIMEHDNPFRPGSELIEEAENILKSVTIVGSQVTVANNDSGIGASSPRPPERSPQANETQLQCSTILSVTSSTPGHVVDGPAITAVSSTPVSSLPPPAPRKDGECVVVRASPESLRPESPPLRAEHVVVTSGGVKTSPKTEPTPPADASQTSKAEDTSKPDKKGKKKGKKKCSLL